MKIPKIHANTGSYIPYLENTGYTTVEQKKVLKIKGNKIWLDNGPGNDPDGPYDHTGKYLSHTMPDFRKYIKELT